MNKKLNNAYKTIGEVAELLNLKNEKNGKLNTYILRFWEKEFKQIKPLIKPSGIRKYTKENIETISIIYSMLKKDGLTIQGAKKRLNSKNISESENLLILKKLNKIKDELKEIKKNL